MAKLDFLVPNGLLGSDPVAALQDTEMSDADVDLTDSTHLGKDASFSRDFLGDASDEGGEGSRVEESFRRKLQRF